MGGCFGREPGAKGTEPGTLVRHARLGEVLAPGRPAKARQPHLPREPPLAAVAGGLVQVLTKIWRSFWHLRGVRNRRTRKVSLPITTEGISEMNRRRGIYSPPAWIRGANTLNAALADGNQFYGNLFPTLIRCIDPYL